MRRSTNAKVKGIRGFAYIYKNIAELPDLNERQANVSNLSPWLPWWLLNYAFLGKGF